MKKYNGFPVEEILLEDCFAMGIVTEAANLRDDIMLFSSENIENQEVELINFKTANLDERIITGIAMVPELLISRNKPNRYVWFSKETIKHAALMFFKNNHQNDTTLEHQYKLNGNTVFESWIVIDPLNDKTNALGFKDVKEGSWAISMKVENEELWNNYLKTGIFKGFSIEAKQKKQKENKNMLSLKKIISFFSGKQIEENVEEFINADTAGIGNDMDSTMLVLEFTSMLDGRVIKMDEMLVAKYIDNNDILETGTYEVKPINDDSAIWVLNIGSDGKVMNFTTPWSVKQETVSDETEAVIEIKNEENIMEEELKMSVENLTSENTELKSSIENFSVEKNNLLLKIEELSNEITAMKSAVDSAVIVKGGQDKYNNTKTEQKSIIALDEIFKNIDSRNKK